jgi:ribonuclease BN (tRNA processing enzyme)
VLGQNNTLLVLDSGTGIRRLNGHLPAELRRVDILLTHLHMDHIIGLGFFAPLRSPAYDVHIWGPATITRALHLRLSRYLSPPLFPVHLRDLPCSLTLHDVSNEEFDILDFHIVANFVCHLDPTLGYRIEAPEGVLAYLPDHEPALGVRDFPGSPEWTSGSELADGVDLLIHDAQYTSEEYRQRVGYGHSSISQTFNFAAMAGAKHLVPFHHDPGHSDDQLDLLFAEALETQNPDFVVTPGTEGTTIHLV